MTDKVLEEFEGWFAKTYPLGNLERDTEEVLRKMIAEQAWRASREAIEVDLPFINDPYDMDANWANEGARKVIKAAGLKVKP